MLKRFFRRIISGPIAQPRRSLRSVGAPTPSKARASESVKNSRNQSPNMSCVYILQSCKNGRYYIGSTVNLERRLRQHNAGMHPSSKRLGPFNLMLKQDYPDINLARDIERGLKKLKRRDYIEKIIAEGRINFGPIAQSVEQDTHNVLVPGSSPGGPRILNKCCA